MKQLFTITDLIDSNYRSDGRTQVEAAPWILLENLDLPRQLLEIEMWIKNKGAVDREIERILSSPEETRGKALIKTINTKMHLTSIIARKMAQKKRREVRAVIVQNIARRNAPFYVRRTHTDLDLTPLIKMARSMDYSAGGKPEVVGMMIPRNQIESMTGQTLDFLEEPK